MSTQSDESSKGPKPFFAKLSDPAIHGQYIGISPIAVMSGCPLERCKISFSVDETGIRLDSAIECEQGALPFTIVFPASWIFRLRNWGVSHCLSVRQHATSKLAQLIFDFTKASIEGLEIDVNMILGEGIPAHLGAFFRQEKVDQDASLLARLYDCLRAAIELDEGTVSGQQGSSANNSHLLPLESEQAVRIMATGTAAEKLEVLNTAGHNLWTGDEAEIKRRLEIVRLGLADPQAQVQKKALSTFVLGGRVVDGVEIVLGFLEQDVLAMDRGVLAEAVEAAICLLCDVTQYNKKTVGLIEEFGTLNLEEMRRKSSGMVTPKQFEAIEEVARVRPQRQFTLAHQRSLRAALVRISQELAEREGYRKISDQCLQGLTNYPVPGKENDGAVASTEAACPQQCDCMCHTSVAMHIMPCCEGPCRICGLPIKFGMMLEHLSEYHGSTEP